MTFNNIANKKHPELDHQLLGVFKVGCFVVQDEKSVSDRISSIMRSAMIRYAFESLPRLILAELEDSILFSYV